jgi:hypothetical protein
MSHKKPNPCELSVTRLFMTIVAQPVKARQEAQHIVTSVLTLGILKLDNLLSFIS